MSSVLRQRRGEKEISEPALSGPTDEETTEVGNLSDGQHHVSGKQQEAEITEAKGEDKPELKVVRAPRRKRVTEPEVLSFEEFFKIEKQPFSWVRVFRALSFLSLALSLGFLVNPRFSVVNPSAYYPNESQAGQGIYAQNTLLSGSKKLGVSDQLSNIQDTIRSETGILYTGSLDGWIRRVDLGGEVEKYVHVGTAIFGLAQGVENDIIVCVGDKGLVRVDKHKEIDVLSTGANGRPFKFVNSAVVTKEGLIYFTDGSDKFSFDKFHFEGLELGLNGRLLVYSPILKRAETVINNLAGPTGVSLSKNAEFLLISDPYRYQLIRFWLKGEREGTAEFVSQNLPGFPGKLSLNKDGTFWLTLSHRRANRLDLFHGLTLVKTALSHFPSKFWWNPSTAGWVLKLANDGEVLESLEDPSGDIVRGITATMQVDQTLYLWGERGGYILQLDNA